MYICTTMEHLYNNRRTAVLLFFATILFYISGLVLDIKPMTMEPSIFFGDFSVLNHANYSAGLSHLLAFLAIVATSVVLLILHSSFSSSTSIYIPFIFIILATANPYSTYLTPLHIASLLIVIYLYCVININSNELESTFTEATIISNILLFLASFFFPPLLWLLPVSFLINLFGNIHKTRYIISFIIGIILPILLIFGAGYVLSGIETPLNLFSSLLARTVKIPEKSLFLNMTGLIKYLLITIGLIAALTTILRGMSTYSTKIYSAYIRIILLLIAIAVIAFVFGPSARLPFGLLIYIPVATLFNDYIAYSSNNNFTKYYFIILALVLITERLTF